MQLRSSRAVWKIQQSRVQAAPDWKEGESMEATFAEALASMKDLVSEYQRYEEASAEERGRGEEEA